MDEFTERLVEAVETAKNNKMLEVEYMSYYANMHDQYNAGLEAGHMSGYKAGYKDGLFAMVKVLKPLLKDFDKVYDAVTETEEYAGITREEVMDYYRKCP